MKRIMFIIVKLPGVVVHSVYKPPAEQFLLSPLGNRNMPHIVIGDFNSHSTLWGFFERSFTYGAPYEWNKLDERVRRLSNFNMFKSEIKTVLFLRYFNS